jgi:hypothetical protein
METLVQPVEVAHDATEEAMARALVEPSVASAVTAFDLRRYRAAFTALLATAVDDATRTAIRPLQCTLRPFRATTDDPLAAVARHFGRLRLSLDRRARSPRIETRDEPMVHAVLPADLASALLHRARDVALPVRVPRGGFVRSAAARSLGRGTDVPSTPCGASPGRCWRRGCSSPPTCAPTGPRNRDDARTVHGPVGVPRAKKKRPDRSRGALQEQERLSHPSG